MFRIIAFTITARALANVGPRLRERNAKFLRWLLLRYPECSLTLRAFRSYV